MHKLFQSLFLPGVVLVPNVYDSADERTCRESLFEKWLTANGSMNQCYWKKKSSPYTYNRKKNRAHWIQRVLNSLLNADMFHTKGNSVGLATQSQQSTYSIDHTLSHGVFNNFLFHRKHENCWNISSSFTFLRMQWINEHGLHFSSHKY